MEKIKCYLGDLFGNVADTFAGSYSNDNVEIKRMREELNTEDVPSVGTDRKNLKSDGSKVSGDYRKAFDIRKEELSLNG